MNYASLPGPFGWKARIGLIVPSTNTVNEPEFWNMAPEGVSIYTARAMLSGPQSEDSYRKMADEVNGAADQLATAEVDVIAYGCTSGSFICPMSEITDSMARRADAPAVTAAGAVVAALKSLGARKIAVATPYIQFVNDREVAFLREHGLEATSLHSLDMGHTQEERRAIGRVPAEAVFRLARAADRPDADALFISCTNLASAQLIAEIEAELGKPVVTSNQACLWACLRLLGLRVSVGGYGRLLAECLDAGTIRNFSTSKMT